MGNIKRIIEKLERKRDLKITSKRKEILKIFIESHKKHLSAKELYLMLMDKGISIGMATIYRTLYLFVEKGIIKKHDFGDDSARYEFVYKEEKKNHHHLICKRCGKVIETTGLLPEELEDILLEREGFQVVDHCLKIYGYCDDCRKGE